MGRALPAALLLLLLVPAAAAGAAPERRLVSFDGALPASLPGVLFLERFDFARVALVEATPAALARLAATPGVAGVYPEETVTLELERVRQVVHADAPPGDAAWPTGAGATVALVDSGIDASHPCLRDRLAASVRIARSGTTSAGGTDSDGHGTHVAGIVACDGAGSRNGRLHGFIPDAKLVSVDISDSFTTTSAVRAFAWIHDHREQYAIRVVSNSWGREKSDAHYDADDPVIRASDALVADGLVVVFSAGNRGRDGAATLTTEGTNPNVLTVGSATASGAPEPYSSKGPARDASGGALDWTKPDLVAPGTAVMSARAADGVARPGATDEERYYVTMNGTSMAAPQVAAAAAMLLQVRPGLTPTLVGALLQQTARDLAARGPDADTGFGMLDVQAAVTAARAMGGARAVPVESREPIHESGTLLGAEGLVLATSGVPRLPPEESVSLPLLFPAGASGVDVWFNHTGTGAYAATLEGGGTSWPFERVAAGSYHLARPVAPGSYRFDLKPTGPVDQASWTLDGNVLILASRLVDEPAELHSRHAAPSHGGFFVPESAAERFLDDVATKPMIVIGALLVCGLAATTVALRRR